LKLAKGPQAPVFGSLFGGHPAAPIENPLAVMSSSDDLEADADAEVGAMAAAIADEKKLRRDAYRTLVDPDFWFAVCFQSREQKEAFLTAVGWLDHGSRYLDGLWIAKRLGVDVQPIPLTAKPVRAAPKNLRDVEVIE